MSASKIDILIIGGGTAGWLAAGILAAELKKNSSGQITLVESPNISTIGVGEGTWPTMRDTLRKIGVSEIDFLVECDASYKQGTQFVNWKDNTESDNYYHPFAVPNGYFDANLYAYWNEKQKNIDFASAFATQPKVCHAHKAPKQLSTPEFAAVNNYGYHLDAGKFSAFLKKHCVEKLGVKYIADTITDIISDQEDYIHAVQTTQNGQLKADLFIDCSGTHGVLIKQHFKIPFIDKSDVLFNDRAIAVQVGYPNSTYPIESATISTAQKSGWIWDIGLSSRRGIGFVYSSQHTNQQAAEETLLNYLLKSGSEKNIITEPRTIKILPGFHQQFWHKNCVAIGMSAGFIEPLEASALVLVELAAGMIREELPTTRETMAIVAKRFNNTFLYRWERIIDFLKLHYILSQRRDSDYWIDQQDKSHQSDQLQELLKLWEFRSPSKNDFPQIQEIFPSASYQYILYGMGYKTTSKNILNDKKSLATAEKYFFGNRKLTELHLSGLPTNRELLQKLKERYSCNIK
ncbi:MULTISPECIES: tryptophan halogenase family protein [unclassified Cellvibrio]|uniref:tryptophan halogenase family protein n=1 Tax=unclassified Cellvibrio TaxID=2624793 RepID=UPI000781D1A9|nr:MULTISPECIES: tryptophan halogenase family protein [unclassified Cellvibrio]QEY17006.1 tryptophan 7-halogenase [Cellvibrio sp. KY-GH-1]